MNIRLYLRVKRVYQHSILWGFSDAWRSRRVIDWQAVFSFINGILNSDDFWAETYSENGYNYRNWIISQIADLINDGTKSDKHALDITLLPEVGKILLLLAEKSESNFHEFHDIVTYVLNSNRGKIFEAMVNYSLRNARINRKDEEYKWVETIKKEFTKRLDKNIEPALDFSVIVGEYLPNLYYLDKDWVISNLNKIFPLDRIEYWEASFTGYLFYSFTVYSNLFKLLSENGHYQKALTMDFKDEDVNDRIAQHICVAYLEGWEKFEESDSLINLLINSKNKRHLFAVINFFWMQRKNITEKIQNKIKPLWEKIFIRMELVKNDSENFKLISDTAKFLSLVDNIDQDIFNWLKLAAEHINDNYNSPFLIENLLKHVDKTPNVVADLFLIILNSGFYPDYKKEQIVELISKFNRDDTRDKVIRICNMYLDKGFEFTRPILEGLKK
jgi:succinate dehydrogenase flavin-adding protein (antitoxin of CptAB toxin-antitoxin module)